MIIIGSFSDIKPMEYDEIWIIVRSLKDKSILTRYTNSRHIPELSPSTELFNCYLSWKRDGHWNKDMFETGYVPRFIVEMFEKPAKDKLNELYFKDKAGKNILLVCFCSTEEKCHRSIVGGLLQGVGVPVMSCNQPYFVDYSYYYKMYKEKYEFIYGKQNSSRQGAILCKRDTIYMKEVVSRQCSQAVVRVWLHSGENK